MDGQGSCEAPHASAKREGTVVLARVRRVGARGAVGSRCNLEREHVCGRRRSGDAERTELYSATWSSAPLHGNVSGRAVVPVEALRGGRCWPSARAWVLLWEWSMACGAIDSRLGDWESSRVPCVGDGGGRSASGRGHEVMGRAPMCCGAPQSVHTLTCLGRAPAQGSESDEQVRASMSV